MFRRRNCSAEKLSGLSDSFAAQTCIVVKGLKFIAGPSSLVSWDKAGYYTVIF